MSNTIKIKRKIGGAKSAPATGTVGEIAFWKAGTALTDKRAMFVHDGVQFVEVVDLTTLVTLTGTETLTNKTLSMANTTLTGTTAQFNTALTDNDFATLDGTETLTNKTLTDPTVADFEEKLASGSGGTYKVTLSSGTVHHVTTNAACTITLPAPVANVAKSFTVIVTYGGAHGLTWTGGGTLKWADGAAPAPTSAAGKTDIFVFVQDGANTYGALAGAKY